MGKAKARGKKAKSTVGAKVASLETKQALQDTARALRDLSGALTEQIREAGIDERAGELATWVRDSEALAKAQAMATQVAQKARRRLQEAGVEDRASELTERVRESETAQQAMQRAREYGDDAMDRLGSWLASGRSAEKLGVQKERRRVPAWLALILGLAGGYVLGMLATSSRREEWRYDMAPGMDETPMPPAGSLADEIRATLGHDPRTVEIGDLEINVSGGTVFVRGRPPADLDPEVVRDVVIKIPGVEDVDVQLTPASA